MLFPALGMTTAIWLVFAPWLGVETGFRAALTVTAGVLALVLGPLAVRYQSAGFAMGALGIFLGLANFVLWAPIGALASLATAACALIVAGMAPQPIIVPALPAADVKAPERVSTNAAPAAFRSAPRVPIAA